jgi:type I restriction enzyme S subunit
VAPIGSILIVFRSGILQHTLPVAITKVETAINQDLKVLVPSEEILSEYLATFLTTFEKRILPRIVKHSTTVQSINQEEFNQLPIPIPSIDI